MAGRDQGLTPHGVELSKEALELIQRAARTIHHGQITVFINRDKPQSVDIEVLSRERLSL